MTRPLQIARADIFEADAGWQRLSFLKLTASDGTAGWAEFSQGFAAGLAGVVRALAAMVLGHDPRDAQRLALELQARGRAVGGGLHAQACAAVENACLDLKARALGVPVYELFGGCYRSELPAYWSHCGLYRVRRPDLFEGRGVCVPRSLQDMRHVAAEVPARGLRALKTNLLSFAADGTADVHMPGFARGPDHPALHVDAALVERSVALVRHLREGAPGTGLMLDLNFNCKPEGARRLASALDGALDGGLEWLEIDGLDADSLAWVRAHSRVPIASLEAAYGRQAILPYLQARAVDVAIIDPMWNGLGESLRMAALADTFQVNVASHLYTGTLATAMCAHFCAAIPNLRIMELDVDRAPGLQDLFVGDVVVRDGCVRVPEGPGWGVIPNESRLTPWAG